MYDTVNFTIDKNTSGNEDLLNKVYTYSSEVCGEGTYRGYYSISANLDNYKISVNENRLSLKGSLCKYYLGDNVKTLLLSDVKPAIEKLSDSLHINFNKASVTRLDIANNYLMKHPVITYYNSLGSSTYYRRFISGSGLYYNDQGNSKGLIFYDKLKEQKCKSLLLPTWIENRNVLRYEYRLKNNVKRHLKTDSNQLKDLYKPFYYGLALNKWYKEYTLIKKKKSMIDKLQPTGSIKEFDDQLAAIVINIFGYDAFIEMINDWKRQNAINRKSKCDLIRRLRRAIENESFGENELLKELDQKIKDTLYIL